MSWRYQMQRRAIAKLALTVGLLALLNSAAAQQTEAESAPEYQVEVLVFEHLDQPAGAYRWPGEPQLGQALDLLPPLRGQRRPVDPVTNRYDFQLLDRAGLGLADAWQRLLRSGPYRPLAHLGWRQPALDGAASIPVRIRNDRIVSVAHAFTDRPDEGSPSGPILQVDGSATFEQRRYKHIKLDLALHRAAPAPLVNPDPTAIGLTPPPPMEPVLPYRTYRITGSRQISPGQAHYFDHRQFGVLVRVVEASPK